jgi:hypothetical protein
MTGHAETSGKASNPKMMRASRAKCLEFDRIIWNEDGRSVSLRSILISNFEFSLPSTHADHSAR